MFDFFSILFSIFVGAVLGGIVAGFFILYQIKRNFFKPRLYFKNMQISPVKGDIEGKQFSWGGLILNGEIYNDSEYWAYGLRIEDIYAEFLPTAKSTLVGKSPLRMLTDLPQLGKTIIPASNESSYNIRPGEHISTSIRIITKNPVLVSDYKNLIKELRMIQLKLQLFYINSSGHHAGTLFWIDLESARFTNIFWKKNVSHHLWKRGIKNRKSKAHGSKKRLEIQS
jgi:hypothetical protein